MYKLSEAAVQVVAQGTRDTLDQFDAGLEVGLRTMADTIAGLRDAGVPAGRVQHVHDSMFDSFENYRNLRKNFIKAVSHLQAIQLRSNHAETAAGCPLPWAEAFTSAEVPAENIVSASNAARLTA